MSSYNEHVHTVVIGAGISGLTAAYTAKNEGRTIKVIESSNRVGGSIRSEKKDGYLLEHGPNTVLPTPEIMSLVDQLELNSQMLIGDSKLPRFIQYNGRLHQVPMSPTSFFRTTLLSRRGRLRILAEPFISASKHNDEESLMEFTEKRLGKEIAERLVAPFVSGIYAGDVTQLSTAATFPKLPTWIKEKGSLLRGMMAEKKKNSDAPSTPKGLLSFNNGLETLPQTLAHSLESDLLLNQTVDRISTNSETWRIEGRGINFTAEKLILTLPAYAAAGLIESLSDAAAETLSHIYYAPLVVMHLAVKTADIKSNLHAFGHLVAPSENLETLGCLYISSIFSNRAPKDTTLLTVFVGGARYPEILSLSDQELLKKAVIAILPMMGLQKHPELISLVRHERAIPQYTIGHGEKIKVLRDLEQEYPGLKFCGNYIDGVSVGDVIKHAQSSAN